MKMNKKYVKPELTGIELLPKSICLNATSNPADDTPAGAKSYHNDIYEDTEETDGWDNF